MAPDQRQSGSLDPPGSPGTRDRVTVGELVLDLRGRDAHVAGRALTLTRIEFDILAYLAAHPGWVSSADQLMEDVWGYRSLGDARTVAVHIGNLRKKLGESKDRPRFIQTVRGAGYKLVDPASLESAGSDAPTGRGAPTAEPPGAGTSAGPEGAARAVPPAADAGPVPRERAGLLIGREAEMNVLAEAWQEVRSRNATASLPGGAACRRTDCPRIGRGSRR